MHTVWNSKLVLERLNVEVLYPECDGRNCPSGWLQRETGMRLVLGT